MGKRINHVRKNQYAMSARDAHHRAAEARRSNIPQRHTPPTSGPNDRRRADPTDPVHRA